MILGSDFSSTRRGFSVNLKETLVLVLLYELNLHLNIFDRFGTCVSSIAEPRRV